MLFPAAYMVVRRDARMISPAFFRVEFRVEGFEFRIQDTGCMVEG